MFTTEAQRHGEIRAFLWFQVGLLLYHLWYIPEAKRGRVPQENVPELPVRFYRTSAGREPVLEWLRSLDREDRRVIGLDLMRVQFGWPMGMPLVRNLKEGLWELRSTLPSRRIARLLLCFHENQLVALHGFIKKTQKTPAEDLNLAKQRMKEVTR